MRHLIYLSFLFSFFLWISCKNDPSEAAYKNEMAALKTNNWGAPDALFSKIEHHSPAIIDSVYDQLFKSLNDSDRFDLIAEHLTFYEQLQGKRAFAKALIYKQEAWVYNYQVKYDSSIHFFMEALNIYNSIGRRQDVAECYYGIAINYYFEGSYAETINANLNALTIYEKLKDSNNIYKIKTEIFNNYIIQKDYVNATQLGNECARYYESRNNLTMLSYVQALQSGLNQRQGNLQKALQFSQSSLDIRQKIGDSIAIAAGLNNIAVIYVALKQWDKAAPNFERAIAIQQSVRDVRKVLGTQQNLALCLFYLNQRDAATQKVLMTIDSARDRKEMTIVTNGYKLLWRFNKESGNYQKALDYHEQYQAYSDSLMDQQKLKTINELQIRYDTKKKEAEIAQLNNDKKLDGIKKIIYLLILILTATTAIFVILLMKNRDKKNKLMIEKVKLELDRNTRELNHFTENAIAKNKLIEELEERLSTSERLAEEATATEVNNEQLSKLYQLKILTEDDWRAFKILFDKVHPGFINRLRDQFPDLAPAEERQFLLIKLKIDNKECADMLGVSTDSVKKNRYRLKKRFNLTEKDNLDKFVYSFV